MIKTDAAYKKAVEKLKEDKKLIELQRQKLVEMGLNEAQTEKALEPMITFHIQLKEEIEYYDCIRRGEFAPILNLSGIGRTLIAYRIYKGMSQEELASKLGVSPAQISRDERNEYYGATVEKLQKVMDVLSMGVKSEVTESSLIYGYREDTCKNTQ